MNDDLISKLSEIRSEYNCFDENEEPYYRVLSEVIKILSQRADGDTISRQAAIDVVHKAIFDFFDICDDDEESPMTYKDEQLLEINKTVTIRIKALPSAEQRGKWIENESNSDILNCSECGEAVWKAEADILLRTSSKYNYCPTAEQGWRVANDRV